MQEKQRKRLLGRLKVFFKEVEVVKGVIQLHGRMDELADDACRLSKNTMSIPDANGLIIAVLEDQLKSTLGDISQVLQYSVTDDISEGMAETLVAWLDDLPHDYQILVRLPVSCSASPEPYTCNNWGLVRKQFSEPGFGYWKEDSAADQRNFDFCICFPFQGAISKYSNQIALDEISTKVCLIIFVLRSVAHEHSDFHPKVDYSGRGWLFAEDEKGGIHKLEKLADLQDVFSEERYYATDQESLRKCIDTLGAIEGIPDKERAKIANAIHWYIGSLADKSFTSSVVKLSIALDALFGNSNQDRGLGATIADRVAFLHGKNMTERTEIFREVKEFYELRSKIVHGDVTVLRAKEREVCWQLQTLLERSLLKEISSYKTTKNQD